MYIPSAVEPLLLQFSFAFSEPTFQRFTDLMLSAILTTGRRTVSNLLRTAPALLPGHASSYHRVFSQRRWSLWKLGYLLAYSILYYLVPEGPVYLVVDDTVDEHRGKQVYGKACHRDAVRSTHSYITFRWGHKWVVLAMLVRFPFTSRQWALPVLVALYHSKEWNKKHGRRHKTPPELARQLLAVLLHWFPEREFILAVDGGFSTHGLAAFAQQKPRRAVLVGRFYPKANLYAPPPKTKGKEGRPRKKGRKLAAPQAVVARTKKRKRLTVRWYGGQTRRVEIVTGTGYWYKGGQGLVEVRWVFVHDLTGTHRDEYFFSTAVAMTPKELIEIFTGRWAIEVTFAEMRAYLGLETTRGRKRETVLRMVPCLFGLYSVVALLYAWLPEKAKQARGVQWVGKNTVTFSDALTSVRRWLWREWIFETCGHKATFSKLPARFQELLCYTLAPAA
jgi:DDE superfamily endonuclease